MPKVHLTKARVFLTMRDAESALTALKSALEDLSESGEIYMRIGEIYESRRDLDDALTAYGSAIRCGLDNSDAHYKRGRVQEMLGNREAAKKSYSASGAKDRNNVRAWERLGTLQLEDNEYAASGKSLDSALAADAFDAPSLLSRARLYAKEGNKEKAVPIYRTLSNRDGSTAEIERELRELLKDPKGPEAEHNVPATAGDDKEHEDIGRTYDLALLALERAYATGRAISDSRMLSDLGIRGKQKDAVLNYLSGIEEYGDIDIRSKEFERMERLSKNVILSERIDDIDSNPLVSIPAAFVASAAETIDDAKKLIAYIYRAINDDSEPTVFSEDVRDAAAETSEMSGDITTYNIMRQFNVGVHTARTIGKLSKMDRKKGVDMHI
jgi:tetratricopeptide (TPR) repeat protein